MQTKEQVAAAFKAEFAALLAKYDADISAEDHFPGYPEDGEDIRMQVTIPSDYDQDGNCRREWTDVDLGNFFNGV